MILKLTVARIMIWKNPCCIYMPKLERMTLTVYFKKLNNVMSIKCSCTQSLVYTIHSRAFRKRSINVHMHSTTYESTYDESSIISV